MSDTRLRARYAAKRYLHRLGPVAGPLLLSPVALMALPLWFVSALTRWLSRQSLLEPPSYPHNLIEYIPEIGARPRPYLDTYGRAEDVFRLTTDGEGWRGSARLNDADLVVVGDSFAFGYGVDDDDFYANLHNEHTVKAIASPAYSMVHGLLWMRRLATRLRGKAVVWLVYTGNDLSDNLRPDLSTYRMPFVSKDDGARWRVRSDHVSAEPWPFATAPRDNQRLFSELCTPSPYSDRAHEAADFLISEAAGVCADAGARLTVVSIPPKTRITDPGAHRSLSPDPPNVDLDLPDIRLARSCQSHGISFASMRPRLRPRHYWREDMHLNAAGHRVVADLLLELQQADEVIADS